MSDIYIKVDPVSERAFDKDGNEWTDQIYVYCRRRAHERGKYLKRQVVKTTGKEQFRMVDAEEAGNFDISKYVGQPQATNTSTSTASNTNTSSIDPTKPKVKPKSTKELLEAIVAKPYEGDDEESLVEYITNSRQIKPKWLKMEDAKWKLLVRSAMRGKNIMMTGPSGEGKTMAVHALVKATGRPFFYIDMGNTQDAQTALIGKTHFDPNQGTYHVRSYFVQAITTPNAVVLLDELTRQSDDASKILMPVLDENQRYLRLTEDANTEKIEVAKGVTFVATANIGNEYTTTSVLDRAQIDRFVQIEVESLRKREKVQLMKEMFPSLNVTLLEKIANIAEDIRENYDSDEPQVDTLLSTRRCIEIANLLYDGFTLDEIANVAIYPLFDKEGGTESPRTFVKQVVQKYEQGTEDDDIFG